MGWSKCYSCKCTMWIPDDLEAAALCRRGPEGIQFFCAYGHRQHFVQGETEAAKLRRERDRLAQRIAEKDDEIARQRGFRVEAERRLAATKGVVTRIKNRVGRGVCPCCNRTFENIARHMANQHPTWTAEAAE